MHMESDRRPQLRAIDAKWEAKAMVYFTKWMKAIGSRKPAVDAAIVLVVLTGLEIGEIVNPTANAERELLAPLMRRLLHAVVSDVVWRMHRIAVVVLLVVGRTAVADVPRFVSEPEIKKSEGVFRDRLAKNKDRHCVRPLLRGTAIAGRAATDLLVFEKPTGAVVGCVASLEKLAEKDGLYGAVESRRADLVAWDQRCGAQVEAAVRKAVSHEDACSPFQIGAFSQPANVVRYIQLAHALGLRARLLGDTDPKAAVWLALDVARWGQDLGRSAAVLSRVIGDVVTELALDSVRVVLERRKLDLSELDAIGAAVDKLQASTASTPDWLASELDYFLLYYAFAPLQPAGWVPPGGWPDGNDKPEVAKPDPKKLHPRDAPAMLMMAGDLISSKVAASCTASGSLMACHAALTKLVNAKVGGMYSAQSLVDALIAKAISDPAKLADEARLKIRSSVADVLADGIVASYPDHVARAGESNTRIAAVKLHIDVLKTIDRTKKCPAAAELAKSRPTKELGDSITATIASGKITVAAPKWTTSKLQPYVIGCP